MFRPPHLPRRRCRPVCRVGENGIKLYSKLPFLCICSDASSWRTTPVPAEIAIMRLESPTATGPKAQTATPLWQIIFLTAVAIRDRRSWRTKLLANSQASASIIQKIAEILIGACALLSLCSSLAGLRTGIGTHSRFQKATSSYAQRLGVASRSSTRGDVISIQHFDRENRLCTACAVLMPEAALSKAASMQWPVTAPRNCPATDSERVDSKPSVHLLWMHRLRNRKWQKLLL